MNLIKQLSCKHSYYDMVYSTTCYNTVRCVKCLKEKAVEHHDWIIDRTCEYRDYDFGPTIKYFMRCKNCNKLETRISQ